MRIYFILSLALLSLAANPYEQRQIFIPSRAAELIKNFPSSSVSAFDGDMAVVQVPDAQIEEWSTFVHERFGKCGGFFDVTADVIAGKSSREILKNYRVATRLVPFSAPQPIVYDNRIASLVATTDTIFIKTFLSELSAFDDRSATTASGTRASEFLAQKASVLGQALPGFQVRKVETRTYPKQPSVVATLPGTNPTLPHIVIGSHMDTLSNNKPGADDDGTGSTIVMESLRNIANSKARFERTIDFMWYAAEERGLVGSENVVRDFKAKNIKVAAVIQFDMTGWVNPVGLHDVYLTDDYTDAGLNQTLEGIIGVYLPGITVGRAECGYACSDHASWTADLVPAVYPFESHHDDYNRRIHTSSDKVDFLSIDHMNNFAKIAVAFLGQMAGIQ